MDNKNTIWLSRTNSGNGIRLFVKTGGPKDTMYIGSFASLMKLVNGEIKGVPLSQWQSEQE